MGLKINILILFFTLTNSFVNAETSKLQITHLTDNFYVYTTFNLYKGSLIPANGMYLVTNNGVVLIDTPWDTTQFQPLLDSIKSKHKKDVVLCIATHSHEDRTAGLEYYKQKGIKTFTSQLTDHICIEKHQKRAEFTFEKDTVFSVDNYSFQTYFGGPGHTPDNIVIWFEKQRVLYGGCLIKSVQAIDLGNLNDANVGEWDQTINNIQAKFENPKFIIPGHQKWTSTKSLKHTLKLVQKYKKENYH
jgi:metallo-beta-lactamase class B